MSIVGSDGSIVGGLAPASIPAEAVFRAMQNPEEFRKISEKAQAHVDEANRRAAAVMASADKAVSDAQAELRDAISARDLAVSEIKEAKAESAKIIADAKAEGAELLAKAKASAAEWDKKAKASEKRIADYDEALAARVANLDAKFIELRDREAKLALSESEVAAREVNAINLTRKLELRLERLREAMREEG